MGKEEISKQSKPIQNYGNLKSILVQPNQIQPVGISLCLVHILGLGRLRVQHEFSLKSISSSCFEQPEIYFRFCESIIKFF